MVNPLRNTWHLLLLTLTADEYMYKMPYTALSFWRTWEVKDRILNSN